MCKDFIIFEVVNEVKEGEYGMTDKQYEGMLKDSIAVLDRVARVTKEKESLNALLYERKQLESKLGYEVPDENLYDSVKSEWSDAVVIL